MSIDKQIEMYLTESKRGKSTEEYSVEAIHRFLQIIEGVLTGKHKESEINPSLIDDFIIWNKDIKDFKIVFNKQLQKVESLVSTALKMTKISSADRYLHGDLKREETK